MEAKLNLILLMVALATVTQKANSFPGGGLSHFSHVAVANGGGSAIGDFIGDENELLLDSESSRRALAARRSYIGYGALKANQVPCGRRGHSYYNCQKRQRANPYKRGCSAITHCARYTS